MKSSTNRSIFNSRISLFSTRLHMTYTHTHTHTHTHTYRQTHLTYLHIT